MKPFGFSTRHSLPYNFFNKKRKNVFYNPLILLTLYKTNQQKIKIYNAFTIKFYGSRYGDYIRRCALRFVDFAYQEILQNTLSLEAKFSERELHKATELLCESFTIKIMNYYHKEEFLELTNCPPENYTSKDLDCYRWVFSEITYEKNFQSQAFKNPKALNDKTDFEKCEYFALSFHTSHELSRKHYNLLKKRYKNFSKNNGTHLAKGKLNPEDGIGGEIDDLSHFNFHFIKDNDFCNNFEIIEEL